MLSRVKVVNSLVSGMVIECGGLFLLVWLNGNYNGAVRKHENPPSAFFVISFSSLVQFPNAPPITSTLHLKTIFRMLTHQYRDITGYVLKKPPSS
jgi:hypothetical protein